MCWKLRHQRRNILVSEEVGFIIEQKDGKWVNYMINPRPSDSRISSVISTLDFWISDDQVILSDNKKFRKWIVVRSVKIKKFKI